MERGITDCSAKNKIVNVQPKWIIYFTCSFNTHYLSSRSIIGEKVETMQDLKNREERFEKLSSGYGMTLLIMNSLWLLWLPAEGQHKTILVKIPA